MELRNNYSVVPAEDWTGSNRETTFGRQSIKEMDQSVDVTFGKRIGFNQSFREFSTRTTFHGVRYIWEEGCLIRRLVQYNAKVQVSKCLSVKLSFVSYQQFIQNVLCGRKNRLAETILLSTHNICFGWEKRINCFNYALLSRSLLSMTQLRITKRPLYLTQTCRMEFPILINWETPFLILWVPGKTIHLYFFLNWLRLSKQWNPWRLIWVGRCLPTCYKKDAVLIVVKSK